MCFGRKVDGAERSFIKKVAEGDESASCHCVLFVGRISPTDPASCILSDGWDSINARLDTVLVEQIELKRIRAGTKLFLSGMQLKEMAEATSPLHLPPAVHVEVKANGAALAKWDAKLGRQCKQLCLAFRKQLKAIHPQGGKIPAVVMLVSRKYGLLKQVTKTDGSKSLLSMKAADLEEAQFEKVYEQQCEIVQNALLKEDKQTVVEAQQEGMKRHEIEELKEQLQQTFLERMSKNLQDELHCTRQVSWKLSAKVTDGSEPGKYAKVTLSVWEPPEEIEAAFAEGSIVHVRQLRCSGQVGKTLYLYCDRSAMITRCCSAAKPCAQHGSLAARFQPRVCTKINMLATLNAGDEFDCVGLILRRSKPVERDIWGEMWLGQDFFMIDATSTLLVVRCSKVKNCAPYNGGDGVWATTSLIYEGFDQHTNTHSAMLTELSSCSRAGKPYILKELNQLKTWSRSAEALAATRSFKQTISALLGEDTRC